MRSLNEQSHRRADDLARKRLRPGRIRKARRCHSSVCGAQMARPLNSTAPQRAEMIRRRALIQFAGTALVGWPLAAGAQQPTKTPRIGFLALGTPGDWSGRVEAFRGGLRELGYAEGKNLAIEF